MTTIQDNTFLGTPITIDVNGAAPRRTVAEHVVVSTPPKRRSLLARTAISIGIWYVYVPHLTLIRLLGPYLGLRLARVTAWLHWLTTFVGTQKELRRTLTRLYPHFDTDLPIRTLIRKHLELKHQSFAEWRLATTRRGKRYTKRVYRTFDDHEAYQDQLVPGEGALFLAYHFGMYKMIQSGLSLCYGIDGYQIDFRSAHYSECTLGPIARLAFRNAIDTDRKSGLKSIYLKPNASPIGIVKRLKRGDIVALAGDGMISSEFMDVPFLGGTLRLPTGWARLAAMTKVPTIVTFSSLEAIDQRSLIVLPPIRCEDNSQDAAELLVLQCAAFLEDFVRRAPWAWHLWHRVKMDEELDGTMHMRIEPGPLAADAFHYEPIQE